MRKLLITMTDNFKETIRGNTRLRIFRQGQERVIRRSYKDFDITKDFELRQRKYALNSLEKKNFTIEPNLDEMSFEEAENYYVQSTKEIEAEMKSDLNQKVILNGLKREVCILEAELLEFEVKNFTEVPIHPKIKENAEKIHYAALHNQPIEKRVLFETFPYLFKPEICQLTDEERLSLPRISSEVVFIDGSKQNYVTHQNNYLNQYTHKQKLIEMELYIENYFGNLIKENMIFIKQAVEEWGWANQSEYLLAVKEKDEENLTYGERRLRDGFLEVDQMKEELEVLHRAYTIRKKEEEDLFYSYFPKSKEFQKICDDLNEHVKKFKTFKIEDTMFIPPEPNPHDKDYILNELRKNKLFDIDEWIENDRLLYKKIINSGLPIEAQNPNEKNEEMNRKFDIVSRVVKQVPLTNHGNIPNAGAVQLDILEEVHLGHLPSEHRIHIEEYYKVLFLNEENHAKYDFEFWNKYFDIDPNTLRNIFNYVYFPVSDYEKPGEVNRILYFKDKEYEERRKLISKMSMEEYNEYLQQTEERPEIAETKRLEYLQNIKLAQEPRITKNTIVYDKDELNKKIDAPLAFSDNMKAIDKKIAEISKGYLEAHSHTTQIEADVLRRIEEMQQISRLEKIRTLNTIEHQKIKEEKIENEKIDEIKKLEERKKDDERV